MATCFVKFQTDCVVEMYKEHHGIHKKLSKLLKCSCLLLLSVQDIAAKRIVIIPADDGQHQFRFAHVTVHFLQSRAYTETTGKQKFNHYI
jgi:hypothetical protein